MSANFIKTAANGDPIYIEIEGLEEVQKELDTLSDELRAKTSLEMVTKVGEKVQWWMQTNILAQGLLKSGDLYRSITVTPFTNDDGAFVYVGPDGSVPYAYIHNYGGTIPPHWVAPVNVRALHWKKDEKDYFSKGHMLPAIKIPARPFIEPAYDDHQQEIIDTMTEILNEAIAEEVATSGASSTWRGL